MGDGRKQWYALNEWRAVLVAISAEEHSKAEVSKTKRSAMQLRKNLKVRQSLGGRAAPRASPPPHSQLNLTPFSPSRSHRTLTPPLHTASPASPSHRPHPCLSFTGL